MGILKKPATWVAEKIADVLLGGDDGGEAGRVVFTDDWGAGREITLAGISGKRDAE